MNLFAPHRLPPAFVIVLTSLAVGTVFACSSGPDEDASDRMDEFIGSPPSDDEDDPLFAHALPAEAVPAEPSGRVGTPDPEPTADEDEPVEELETQLHQKERELQRKEQQLADARQQLRQLDEPDDQREQVVEELQDQLHRTQEELERKEQQLQQQLHQKEQELQRKEQQLADARQQLRQTREPADDIEPPAEIGDDRKACFSCVRICPRDEDGQPHCTDDPDDLICGWGSHETDASKASRVAEAQCESSLDMARHLPNYADIDGNCPPATCR